MNIFYYYWGENSRDDMVGALRENGFNVLVSDAVINGYDNTADCEKYFGSTVEKNKTDMIFSFNYLPFLSEFAKAHYLPYVSWVYDCPHLTLYSTTIANENNHIFIFDRNMCEQTKANGAKHVYHLPLAVNMKRIDSLLSKKTGYDHDVSFVGSMYENNLYDKVNYLPEYLRGYIDSVITSQQEVWGINLVSKLLTDDITTRLSEYISIPKEPKYTYSDKEIFSDMILKKIASTERKALLSEVKGLSLFTEKNPVSYTEEMPVIFKKSRININISLRSIESGIPLRCMDIMGCGGFLLTNYQPELDEFFVNGEDYVYYESREDMLLKIDHYLSHDAEREEIARNGHAKISAGYDMVMAAKYITDTVTKDHKSDEPIG